MTKFPSYGFPFQYYRPNNYIPRTPAQEPISVPLSPKPVEPPKPESSYSKQLKTDFPVWFDLFGIKLYFDDVLILSLLFFLYKEEVKDEGLFLALILLLIS